MTRNHALIAIVLAATILFFQNCAKPPVKYSSKSASSLTGESPSPTPGIGTLSLNSANYSVYTYGQTLVTASGGEPPYTYGIASSQVSGTINPQTGVFTATATAGYATVMVTDARGTVAYVNLNVIDSSTTATPSPSPCPTVPQTADGQTCYAGPNTDCTVAVSFAAKVPAGCRAAQVTVTANYGGGYGACTPTGTTLSFSGTGNKGAGLWTPTTADWMDVGVDFAQNKITVKSMARGYAGPNYTSPYLSCVSDIRYNLILEKIP